MAVEQVAIKNVIDGAHILGATQDEKRKTMSLRHCLRTFSICRRIQIYGKELQALSRPSRMMPIDRGQVFIASLCFSSPEDEQQGLSAQRRQNMHLPTEIGKSKLRGLNRCQQPGFCRGGQRFDFLWLRIRCLSIGDLFKVRGCFEGLESKWLRAFLNPSPVIDRQIMELLHQSAGPANRGSQRAFRCSQTEKYIFAVLR